MKTGIFIECLEQLNRKMYHCKRSIALLLDNFSAHEAAIRHLGGERGLSNIRIIWLPKNTTSHYQPCDQVIIHALKPHARERFLAWQVFQYDSFIDHNTAILKDNLLQAIHWTVAAWEHNMKNKPVLNCFTVMGDRGVERLTAQRRVWHGKRGIYDTTLGVEYGTVICRQDSRYWW